MRTFSDSHHFLRAPSPNTVSLGVSTLVLGTTQSAAGAFCSQARGLASVMPLGGVPYSVEKLVGTCQGGGEVS